MKEAGSDPVVSLKETAIARSPKSQSASSPRRERIALVLQGGGALGSYQGGVYEALDKAGHRPSWIAGISIGAINGALIAGNPPERATERVREFWDLVSSSVTPVPFLEEMFETAFNQTAAATTLMFGAPGFFKPRLVNPFTAVNGGAGAVSFYDTAELKSTLERLVDFDRVNDRTDATLRLSVGAVNIRTGNFAYFDSMKDHILPEHIMASGALPPGLPPVEIDGEFYWDGGLVSNTPLQYVIDEDGKDDLLAFQLDLFSARGPMPTNLLEAAEREKDIRYSSRTRLGTDIMKRRQEIGAAALRLAKALPPEWRKNPDLALLTEQACAHAVTIVHLIYKSKNSVFNSKDYEFSRSIVDAHWAAGLRDAEAALSDPEWLSRGAPKPGSIRTFDHANTKPAAKERKP